MARRNPIIEAEYEDDGEQELGLPDDFDDGDEETFDAATGTDALTDEEVVEEVQRMDAGRREQVEKSRQRGRANTKGQRTVHQSASKQDARARTPKRERQVEWSPANTLDAPPPRPGMDQRWIRFQLADKNDPRNWSRKMREGWAVRKLDTVSDEYSPPTVSAGQLGEVIGVGDLILCERPVEMGRSRKRYFRRKYERQMAAAERRHVDKVSKADHPISITHPTERPTVGRGTRRRAPVQGDDE